MKNRKNKVLNIMLWVILIILIIFLIIFVLSLIILNIYAFVVYKDTPISEIPWWVVWLII